MVENFDEWACMQNTIFVKETGLLWEVYGKYAESNIQPQKVIYYYSYILPVKKVI